MLILGLILFGMMIGGAAQLSSGNDSHRIDWGIGLVAGLAGSFVGGRLIRLSAGDVFVLRPSGIIGSILGATIVSLIWLRLGSNWQSDARHHQRS